MGSHSQKLLEELSFIVIDLETTGGNHKCDQIFEIGLVKIKKLQIVEELHHLINPEMEIPPFVQRLTSISNQDLVHAPRIADIIDELTDFIGDSIIVAHNISFDLPFFNSVLKRLERPELKNLSLCTNLMSQYLIPEILNSNLSYMGGLFGIPHDRAHRALEDAKASALLLLKFLNAFINKGINKVNQLYYPQAKFKLNSAYFTMDQKEALFKTIKKIKSCAVVHLKGKNGLQLACLPLENPSLEQEIISGTMEMVDCHSISIDLVGPLFEAFLQYNAHYNKIKAPINNHILSYLNQKHLGGLPLKFNSKYYSVGLSPHNFLIAHHLISAQLSLYPLFSLENSNPFIFRFPDHKKRFFHHAIGLLKKFERNKKRQGKHLINKGLFAFLKQYLSKAQEEKNNPYLFIDKNILKKDQKKFGKLVQKFANSKCRKHDYPKHHL